MILNNIQTHSVVLQDVYKNKILWWVSCGFLAVAIIFTLSLGRSASDAFYVAIYVFLLVFTMGATLLYLKYLRKSGVLSEWLCISIFMIVLATPVKALVMLVLLLYPFYYCFFELRQKIAMKKKDSITRAEENKQKKSEEDQYFLQKTQASQKKLHTYINAIIENFNDVSGQDSSDEALARAINDSMDKISQDDIQPANFLSPIVQADLKTIVEHLEHHSLAKHLVFKKLKATFATKTKLAQEQYGESAPTEPTTLEAEITKQLNKAINEIFSYILQLPAEKPEDTKMLLQAINSSISEITLNADTIKPAYYQEPVVQSNIQLILEHLDEHRLSNNLITKRLKNLFSLGN
ncbi:MAG: hypothetical protein ACKN9T_14410 [Candidatus Methylumidiphilus sp.]